MTPWRFYIFGILILIFCVYRTQTFDGCLCVEEIANGLQLPVSLVHANDGSNRIFVAEQHGVVNIFYPNGTKLPEPFIDVSSRIGILPRGSETGVADIVFHPNVKSNGLFYMLFSTPEKNKYVDHQSNLVEFKVSATDENKADPDYSRLLLRIAQPKGSHNANQVVKVFLFCIYTLFLLRRYIVQIYYRIIPTPHQFRTL